MVDSVVHLHHSTHHQSLWQCYIRLPGVVLCDEAVTEPADSAGEFTTDNYILVDDDRAGACAGFWQWRDGEVGCVAGRAEHLGGLGITSIGLTTQENFAILKLQIPLSMARSLNLTNFAVVDYTL